MAKHWFTKFLDAENEVLSWRSFRLFLRCVDSRFWYWHEEIIEARNENADIETRLKFFKNNHWNIKQRIKKNEGKLTEYFLGEKIMQDQVWPWMSYKTNN